MKKDHRSHRSPLRDFIEGLGNFLKFVMDDLVGKPRAGEKSKYNFSWYVVAWIDVLGQSKKLETFDEIPTTKEEEAAFLEKARETFGVVANFRKRILELHNLLTRKIPLPESLKGKLIPQQLAIYEKYAMTDVQVQFICDSAILKISLLHGKASPLPSLDSLISQLAIIQLAHLGVGRPLRGSISLGVCAELGENDLYGQAVSRAHMLESKVADYPRIVIDETLLEYLNFCDAITASDQERKLIRHLTGSIRAGLIRDSDGRLILSYLGQKFKQMYGDQPSFQQAIQGAGDFISSEIEKYQVAKDEEMLYRYIRLRDYFKGQGCWAKPA
ncbi:MAG: hypothetical protein HY590_00740 [Candidatus Omnitrophica bacterium]|nr:hypothetical protein [Candidatus Omnitrophota bacterium]MBI4435933.1 hypothetical protein [Candidatus Omnitrophota bacterium]